MSELSIFYVYILFRPWDGSPFYVGKGRGERWLDHQHRSRKHYNPWIKSIFDKARRLGLEVPRVKVRVGLTEAEAFATERAFISALGRKKDGGPLANLTDGGDGVSGWVHSNEAKAKIGAASKGHKYSVGNKNCVGRKMSQKTRLMLSLANKGSKRSLGRKHSEETKSKIKAIVKARWLDPTFKASMIEIRKIQGQSEEHRANRSAIATSLWSDPEYRRRTSEAHAGRKASDEHRANISRSVKEFSVTPEGRAARSAAGKARWAKHRAKLDTPHPH